VLDRAPRGGIWVRYQEEFSRLAVVDHGRSILITRSLVSFDRWQYWSLMSAFTKGWYYYTVKTVMFSKVHAIYTFSQSSSPVMMNVYITLSLGWEVIWWRNLICINSFSKGKLPVFKDALWLSGSWPRRQAHFLQQRCCRSNGRSSSILKLV
jgi:hypothetical protein